MVVIAALDLWTLLVEYTFGNFFLAVVGITLVLFIIIGVLGRTSIWTTTWYCIMFIAAMTLGYGFIALNIIITLILLISVIFAAKSYIDSK